MKLLDNLFGRFSQDIGIDLGTANTLVYVRGEGIVINEPSVVAINKKTNDVLAIGKEAQRMVGKTPSHIVAIRPLKDGVISDFEVTEQMLRYFIQKVHQDGFRIMARPRVVIGLPSSVTEVERRAVEEATLRAGARSAPARALRRARCGAPALPPARSCRRRRRRRTADCSSGGGTTPGWCG
jgi:rod shape-determining protein MreB and related proteins